MVALDDRDLHQVAGGIGGDLAVPHVRLHLLHTGQKLARDDANDADQATASVDPEACRCHRRHVHRLPDPLRDLQLREVADLPPGLENGARPKGAEVV